MNPASRPLHTAHAAPQGPPWAPAAQRVQARLAGIRAQPDGAILTRISGPHFVVLTKEESEIRLWLMDQTRPSTGVVQSEMNLDAPLALIEGYTQAMTLALLWKPNPQRVFFSGLGGGRVPLVFHCLLPSVEIFSADIDEHIIEIAASHFGLDVGNRIAVDLADGRQWLEQRTDCFDAIVVDVFLDNGYTPYRQATQEFYALCRARLRPQGVLVINLLERDPYTAHKLATLKSVFPHVYYVSIDEENTIAFASTSGHVHPGVAGELAAHLNVEWRLPYGFESLAAQLQEDLTQFDAAWDTLPLLHDDAPPLDYFATLPSLTGPFGKTEAASPCPCGSGRAFGLCHGTLT
jgi:spermidine synthase